MTEPGFKKTELGMIPEEWDISSIEECAEILDSKRIPLSEFERNYRKGEFPYCGANGVVDYIDNYIFAGEYVLIAEDGGNYDRFQESAYLMKGKFWVNNHAHILKANPGKSNNEFLLYWLNFNDLRKYISGSTRTKLNQASLRNIPVLAPPLPEQQKIAEILSTADKKIELIDNEILAAEKLKKGLMQTLLTRGIGHTKFKKTEIGEIPEEWQIKRLGEFVSLKNGLNFGKDAKGNTGIAVIDVLNMYGDSIYADAERLYKINNTMDSEYMLQKGDILFVRSSLKKEGVGWASLTPNVSNPISFVGFIIRARLTDSEIDQEFLTYFLRGDYSRRYFKSHAGQVAITNISQETIQSILFPFFSHSEQLKIVEILNTVDKRKELLRVEKRKTELIKRKLMQVLLTGKKRVNVESTEGVN